MADVFISYSQKDPEPTKALAADLEARGYTTWWDTSLLPGERFPDKIRQELEAAKVVIVIWSENSVKSEWVYAEAQAAQALGKLVTVHVAGFDLKKVPMPFGARHIEPVTSRAKLYAALEMLGVKVRTTATAAPMEEAGALYRRGEDYLNGRGVTKNYAEAVRLFRRAADMDQTDAMVCLGFMYMDGQGVVQDDAEATRHFREAADLGSDTGRRALAAHTEYLANCTKIATLKAKNAASEAKLALIKRVENSDANAAHELARSYENEGNNEQARRFYQKAVDLGDTDAAKELKRLIKLKGWFS